MSHLVTVPVEKSVVVDVPQAQAFSVFTEKMGSWWPMSSHSIAPDDTVDVEMECRLGGSIFERHRDGGTAEWGTIDLWDPPARLVFSWNPSYESRPRTEVEVRFIEVTPHETRVEIEHRGWERLGDAAHRIRDGYDSGWVGVLELFGRAASK